jgi:hypothetical protein
LSSSDFSSTVFTTGISVEADVDCFELFASLVAGVIYCPEGEPGSTAGPGIGSRRGRDVDAGNKQGTVDGIDEGIETGSEPGIDRGIESERDKDDGGRRVPLYGCIFGIVGILG